MAVLYTQHFVQFFDDNGNPLSGGKLYTYDAGTTTPKATYTTAAGNIANANPVILDSAGRATVFLDGTSYRFDLKTASDVLVRSTDNIQSFGVVQQNIQNTSFALMPANTIKGNASISSATPTDISFSSLFYALNIPSGMQNMFRNPFMEVAQRGTSGTVTAGTKSYTLDGWAIYSAGANLLWQQAGPVSNGSVYSLNSLGLLGATSLTSATIDQKIESNISAQFAGKRVTVQYLISNQTGASLTITLTTYYPTATDNYTSITTDLSSVNLQTIPSGGQVIVSYTFNTNILATRGYMVELGFGGQLNGAGKNVYITAADIRFTPDAPLGLNSSPPRPEYRATPIERTFCERYYETSNSQGESLWSGNTSSGAMVARVPVRYRTIKRGVPVVTTTNANRNGFPTTNPVVEFSSVGGFDMYLAANATVTDGYLFTNWTSSAEF